MWVCPKCGRKFKRANQSHGCRLISKDSLFEKRTPELKKLYDRIAGIVNKLGEYREETVPPDVIFFKTESTFLEVKVKTKHLEVVFFLEKLEDVHPVVKYLQTSKNRVVHVVFVDRPGDINAQLKSWIKRSFMLINK